jgi:signal recognition particle subunit SRP54
MGDVINLVKKAEANFDEKESLEMEEKLKKASFTYDDYLKQMGRVKKMGSFKSLLKMLPGMSSLGDLDFSDKEFNRLEAMILSMTPDERFERDELTHSRRKRIARGSGVDIEEVNRMVKGFKRVKQLFKSMPDMKAQAKKMGLSDMKKQFEGIKWH